MADEDEAVREEAAAWYFRRDAGPLVPRDERAFQRWLAHAPHREAYDEVARTWSSLAAVPRPALPTARQRPIWRRNAIAAGLAAMLAIAVAPQVQHWWVRQRSDYATAVGETRDLVLADGSRISLNTDTAVAIRYGAGERRIRLLSGEALFTVAKDTARPFIVEARSGAATALGTAFAVRQDDDEAVVTVLESRVAVAPAEAPERSSALSPGQSARLSRSQINAIEIVDADAETAWRRGKLIFVDQPLGAVVEQLNRYHHGRIQIVDPAIRNHRVSGVFETKDPLQIVTMLESSLSLRSTRLTSYLVLLHR
ncbi:FecR family protein [Bosea sp. NPDC003192]|uniref:FecR family protein n=1 Tax=Bosea sp. NPDC003192 TaxID=3390551 RepID=UPI003D03B76A